MHETNVPDPDWFTALVDQYQLPLLRMCILQLRDPELARDAVQETFIKVYRAWPAFRGGCSVQTWLMRIAINTCRDMQRTWWHRHVNGNPLPETVNRQDFPEDALLLNLEIARLPAKLREAVLLYYYQELSMEETAEALGISLSAASKRLKKARIRLCAVLKGAYFDE